jgi:tetratricopeptide (TPR) repeat protein
MKDYPAALQAAEDGLSLALETLPKTIQEEPGGYLSEEFTAPSLEPIEQAQREKEGDPRPELFLAKADALTGLERYEDALQTLNQAMHQFSTKIIFYRYAAALLLKMGKPEEALAQFDSARKAKVKLDAPSRMLVKKIKAVLTQ